MGVIENYKLFLQEFAEAATGITVDIKVFRAFTDTNTTFGRFDPKRLDCNERISK